MINSHHALHKNMLNIFAGKEVLKLFMYAPVSLRALRMLPKNFKERGYSAFFSIEQWPSTHKSSLRFIEPRRDYADYLVINWEETEYNDTLNNWTRRG